MLNYSLAIEHKAANAKDFSARLGAISRATSSQLAETVELQITGQRLKDWAIAESRILNSAETFVWTKQTAMAARSAADSLPPSTKLGPELFPSEAGWFWFEEPVSVTVDCMAEIPGADELWSAPVRAISWMRGQSLMLGSRLDKGYPDGCGLWFSIYVDNQPHAPHYFESCFWWPEHWTLDEASRYDGREKYGEALQIANLNTARFMGASLLWMSQRVIVCSRGHIERHTRKRVDALVADKPAFNRTFNIVQLRRRASDCGARLDCDEPVEWSHRWVVSGHWRNQYIPSSGEHRPIWILPYVKGPEGKPLLVSGERLFSVSR